MHCLKRIHIYSLYDTFGSSGPTKQTRPHSDAYFATADPTIPAPTTHKSYTSSSILIHLEILLHIQLVNNQLNIISNYVTITI